MIVLWHSLELIKESFDFFEEAFTSLRPDIFFLLHPHDFVFGSFLALVKRLEVVLKHLKLVNHQLSLVLLRQNCSDSVRLCLCIVYLSL